MATRRFFSRRWLVPVAALGATTLIGALPHLVGLATATTPNLPPITAAQLLERVRSTRVRSLSGMLALTSNLGVPSLGPVAALGGGGATTSLASLVSGTHTARIWVDGPEHLRVASLAPLAETNWVRNGADLWSYDSSTLTTTHATIPAKVDHSINVSGPSGVSTTDPPDSVDAITVTPQGLAQDLLDKITPSTQVSVDPASTVAGRDAYRLVLSPNDVHSTIGRVVISVDATTGLPLDVTITARSSGVTAFELGFTGISYAAPSASEFDFTAPPGSTVVEAPSPSALLSAGANPHGSDGVRVRHHRSGAGINGPIGIAEPTPISTPSAKPQVIGSDWGSAVILSNSSITSQVGRLLQGAPVVAVGSGQARVISTALFNVLVLDDGRIAIGAVDVDTLASLVAGA